MNSRKFTTPEALLLWFEELSKMTEEVRSDYWKDKLLKLRLVLNKVIRYPPPLAEVTNCTFDPKTHHFLLVGVDNKGVKVTLEGELGPDEFEAKEIPRPPAVMRSRPI